MRHLPVPAPRARKGRPSRPSGWPEPTDAPAEDRAVGDASSLDSGEEALLRHAFRADIRGPPERWGDGRRARRAVLVIDGTRQPDPLETDLDRSAEDWGSGARTSGSDRVRSVGPAVGARSERATEVRCLLDVSDV